MTLYLGIDGGGTGCRAAIADGAGRILGQGTGGPANIATDLAGARDNILAAVAEALPAGAALGDLRAVLGLAGANAASAAMRLAADLPFARARIESDALIAVKGALQGDDGIVAAIGTGSVFAVQRAGAVRQIGGWGLVLGDEASGAWIGRRVLALALRAQDGFIGKTALGEAFLEELGGPAGVVRFAGSARPVDFAAFARRVVTSPDILARAVLAEASASVAEAIDLLQGQSALPVVFLGGLGPTFAARLAGRWPIRPSLGSALDGALWLARQEG